MSPSPLRSTFGRPNPFRETASFRFVVLYLGGGPRITRVHVFDFPFEEDNRSLEVAFEAFNSAVKSVKNPIKSSLMVPGLSMLPYLGYYPDF